MALSKSTSLAVAAVLLTARLSCGADAPRTFALTDVNDLVERGVKVDAVEYKGRKAIRLIKESNGEGFAILKGTDFQDGTIEGDVAVKVTTPPGVRMPGFLGIGF